MHGSGIWPCSRTRLRWKTVGVRGSSPSELVGEWCADGLRNLSGAIARVRKKYGSRTFTKLVRITRSVGLAQKIKMKLGETTGKKVVVRVANKKNYFL